jgi:hypothetical protein
MNTTIATTYVLFGTLVGPARVVLANSREVAERAGSIAREIEHVGGVHSDSTKKRTTETL